MSNWIKRSESHPSLVDEDSMGRILVWNDFSGFSHLLHTDHLYSESAYTHWMPLPSPPGSEQ